VGGNAQIKAMKQVAGTLRLSLAQFRELEAFAQFGSDLDKATQAQLNRGRRLVEILKQGLHQTVPVAKQVLIIYAAAGGFIDDVPVESCREFERELYVFFDHSHPDLLEKLAAKSGMTDEVKAAVGKGIKEVADRFRQAAPVAG
jgi:F-type H+-transporting ATPase subunit alpha